MSLLNKLTAGIDEYKPKSNDPVADALERALDNTTVVRAGVPWDRTSPTEPFDNEELLKNELLDKLLGKK